MSLWDRLRKTKEVDLVLNASGVRAPCFVGCIEGIIEKGYEIKRIAGSSGGAIIAAGYALGRSIEELKQMAPHTPYESFKDFSIKNLCSLTNPSVYSGKPLDDFYRDIFGEATLKDFKIDCKIAVVTILGRDRIILDKEKYPNLPVWKAVRMSSTIPFIFPYQELDGIPVTDGALITNMFDIFPEGERLLVTLSPRADFSVKRKVQDVQARYLFIWNYLKILAEYFLDAADNRHIPQEEWGKTIVIPTFEIGGFNFQLSPQDVERLIQYGYNAVIVSDVM
ncbi:MAG: hypothetical protein GF334_04755 [Candidatus Altiarchaeales archaeon]|nr:hypothetical protein [Candidatus Altiarchaeales archaeon]